DVCGPADCTTGAPVSKSRDGAPVEKTPAAERCGRLALLLAEFAGAILGSRRGNAGCDTGDDRRAADRFQNLPRTGQGRLETHLPLLRLGSLLSFCQQPVGFACSGLRPLSGRLGSLDSCIFYELSL